MEKNKKLKLVKNEFLLPSNGCCFLCLKTNRKPSRPCSFVRLSNYLKISFGKLISSTLSPRYPISSRTITQMEESDLKVELCEECYLVTETFGKLQEKLEKARMELEANLLIILEIINTEVFDKYRQNKLRLDVGRFHVKLFHSLRKETLKKGEQIVRESFPFVLIDKMEDKEFQDANDKLQKLQMDLEMNKKLLKKKRKKRSPRITRKPSVIHPKGWCHICNKSITLSYLPEHIDRVHSNTLSVKTQKKIAKRKITETTILQNGRMVKVCPHCSKQVHHKSLWRHKKLYCPVLNPSSKRTKKSKEGSKTIKKVVRTQKERKKKNKLRSITTRRPVSKVRKTVDEDSFDDDDEPFIFPDPTPIPVTMESLLFPEPEPIPIPISIPRKKPKIVKGQALKVNLKSGPEMKIKKIQKIRSSLKSNTRKLKAVISAGKNRRTKNVSRAMRTGPASRLSQVKTTKQASPSINAEPPKELDNPQNSSRKVARKSTARPHRPRPDSNQKTRTRETSPTVDEFPPYLLDPPDFGPLPVAMPYPKKRKLSDFKDSPSPPELNHYLDDPQPSRPVDKPPKLTPSPLQPANAPLKIQEKLPPSKPKVPTPAPSPTGVTKDAVEANKGMMTTMYLCPICDKEFPSEEAFRHHNDSKHVTYKCEFCEELFDQLSILKRHYMSNHHFQ